MARDPRLCPTICNKQNGRGNGVNDEASSWLPKQDGAYSRRVNATVESDFRTYFVQMLPVQWTDNEHDKLENAKHQSVFRCRATLFFRLKYTHKLFLNAAILKLSDSDSRTSHYKTLLTSSRLRSVKTVTGQLSNVSMKKMTDIRHWTVKKKTIEFDYTHFIFFLSHIYLTVKDWILKFLTS